MCNSFLSPYSLLSALAIMFFSLQAQEIQASTNQIARPLGVLISPIPSEIPAAKNNTSDKGPQTIRNQAPPPLGILINKAVGFENSLPDARPKSMPIKEKIKLFVSPRPASIPNASLERPLGILIKSGKTTLNRAAQPTSRPKSFPPIPKKVSLPPLSSATKKRPLGILFRPDGNTTFKTSVTSSPQTESKAIPSQNPLNDSHVNLSADQMTFDRDQKVVKAIGNVHIRHKGRKLIADSVTYNQKTDIVTAEGGVTLLEPTGEKVFGNKIQITGDLKDAVIENVGIILKDHARIVGAGARRSAARVTKLSKATYTPCKVCEDDPQRPPLWQIKAIRIIHDKGRQIVEYQDAWVEM